MPERRLRAAPRFALVSASRPLRTAHWLARPARRVSGSPTIPLPLLIDTVQSPQRIAHAPTKTRPPSDRPARPATAPAAPPPQPAAPGHRPELAASTPKSSATGPRQAQPGAPSHPRNSAAPRAWPRHDSVPPPQAPPRAPPQAPPRGLIASPRPVATPPAARSSASPCPRALLPGVAIVFRVRCPTVTC